MTLPPSVTTRLPGLGLALGIAALAIMLERVEFALLGFAWVDGLVLAILLGTGVHTLGGLKPRALPGVQFASKTLLEIAIVLLGASISFSTLADAGAGLLGLIALAVFAALVISYAIGRALGLPVRLATLVACGNSICGNSAIVAAAPVIDARSDEIAASIAFTAALGILVVLLLPLAPHVFGIGEWQYGVLAGMTVYAVPQVLAATLPVGLLSAQIATLVKLTRVMMLGPVILLIGLKAGGGKGGLRFGRIVPWFILGFFAMMTARSLGLLPEAALGPVKQASTLLTIISMAALGLSVNLRTVFAAGGRVLLAGVLSLLALGGLSATMLAILPVHL